MTRFIRLLKMFNLVSGILQNEIDMFIYTLMEINTQAWFRKIIISQGYHEVSQKENHVNQSPFVTSHGLSSSFYYEI